MKVISYILALAVSGYISGCAPTPPAETVKRSVVKVEGDSFCRIMCPLGRSVGRSDCKLGWSVTDNKRTIDGTRRLAEAVDSQRCGDRR